MTQQTEEDIMRMIGEEQSGGIAGDMSGAAYNGIQQQENNLIVWQLELDNILERIEHLLKGDVLGYNKETQQMDWITPDNNDLVILNQYGVQLIMNTISFYLNRNTILSNYKEERINEILMELGHLLADVVFVNYEKMGLDTIPKKSRSEMLVLNVLNMLESTYNRALNGQEKDSLRTARVVTQSQPLGQRGIGSMTPAASSGFSLNPLKGFRK